MITDNEIRQLNDSFKRVFALPITRLTLREAQNAVSESLPGKSDILKGILDSLAGGEVESSFKKEEKDKLKPFIEAYSVYFKIAADIYERGEFLNSFTSDITMQGNNLFFVNRMRRIDGHEFSYNALPENNLRLARMFISRYKELRTQSSAPLDPQLAEELKAIKKDLEALLK
jgi:hypothetical protein